VAKNFGGKDLAGIFGGKDLAGIFGGKLQFLLVKSTENPLQYTRASLLKVILKKSVSWEPKIYTFKVSCSFFPFVFTLTIVMSAARLSSV
jgi:hypothetical protein